VPAEQEGCVLLEPGDAATSVTDHDWQDGAPVPVGVLYRRQNEGEASRLLAMRLAVREINDNLGLSDQRRAVMVACDYGGPSGLVDGNAARADIEDGVSYLTRDLGVSAIIAGSSSATTQVAINHIVRRDLSVAYVSSFSTSTQLTDYDDNGLLWRTAATDAGQAVALAKLVAGAAGLSHLAIVYVDDTYGRSLQQDVNVELARIAGGISTSLHSFASSETSFDSVVASALSQSPDGMLVIGVDGATVISVYEALVATDDHASVTHHFVADAAKDQTSLLSPASSPDVRSIVAGALGTAPYHSTGAQYATFKQALADGFAVDADGFSFLAQSYDAAYLAAYGLAYAGPGADGGRVAEGFSRTVAGPTILVGKPDWNEARRRLSEGEDADRTIDIDGTSGPLDFDIDTGDTTGPMEIWRPTADFSSFETCAVCSDDDCDLDPCQ
jgi:branched-chain amino acid transport system substrate-binding protein